MNALLTTKKPVEADVGSRLLRANPYNPAPIAEAASSPVNVIAESRTTVVAVDVEVADAGAGARVRELCIAGIAGIPTGTATTATARAATSTAAYGGGDSRSRVYDASPTMGGPLLQAATAPANARTPNKIG